MNKSVVPSQSMATRAWRPLLQGSLKEEALEAIESIFKDLSDSDNLDKSPLGLSFPHSLSFGSAGIALAFLYLFQVSRREAHAETARRYMDEAISALSSVSMLADLYMGFSGIAWTYEHLRANNYGARNAEDMCAEIDVALLSWCTRDRCTELLEGLGGICLYCFERGSKPTAIVLRQRVVGQLLQNADRLPSGATWRLAHRQYRYMSTMLESGEIPHIMPP